MAKARFPSRRVGFPSLIAVALAAMVSSARAGEVSGAAIVVDGDTLAIAGQRFDLLGIDAPELPQLCEADGKRWACGEDATMVLRRIIAGREVTCAAHGEGERGAVLAVCRIGFEGLNREMVRAGMALNPPRGPALYVREEAAAKAYPRGLWASRFVTPWAWRAGARLDPPPGGG
jgi:endonuclease YncB( thermonuclease family)